MDFERNAKTRNNVTESFSNCSRLKIRQSNSFKPFREVFSDDKKLFVTTRSCRQRSQDINSYSFKRTPNIIGLKFSFVFDVSPFRAK